MNLPIREKDSLKFTKTFLSEKANHTLYRVVIWPNSGDSITAYFLVPKNIPPPYPIMICLQGHAPGMYISIGKGKSEKDKKLIAGSSFLRL